MQIKNIIFDMGRVLIEYRTDELIKLEGITSEEDIKLLNSEVFLSVEWAKTDMGLLHDYEASEIICKRVPSRLHETVHRLVEGWHNHLKPIEGMSELCKKLKEKGYKLYLLSNAGYSQITYWKNIPGSEYFDGRVVSAEELVMKPDKRIYQILLDRYNLVPKECVFIDDNHENCLGAELCDINSIVFHGDLTEVYEKLKELGVEV